MKNNINYSLDSIDRKLLRLLQDNAKATAGELAEKVGLSVSPCARRIRRLEEAGFITGIHARLNRKQLGLSVTVFVNVRLSQHREKIVDAFEEEVKGMEEVTECYTVSGDFDYLLHVVCKDNEDYEKWVRKLQCLDIVNTIDSRFVIRPVKENGGLKVKE